MAKGCNKSRCHARFCFARFSVREVALSVHVASQRIQSVCASVLSNEFQLSRSEKADRERPHSRRSECNMHSDRLHAASKSRAEINE